MELLALDLGTNFGYTVDGTKGFTIKLPKEDTKYYLFRQYILDFIELYKLTNIVYEAAAFQPGAAIPIYHGLVGVLKATAKECGIPVIGIAVGTIKKSFTGNGRADKKEVIAMCDKLGYTYDDHNSADALAVYSTFVKLYGN